MTTLKKRKHTFCLEMYQPACWWLDKLFWFNKSAWHCRKSCRL